LKKYCRGQGSYWNAVTKVKSSLHDLQVPYRLSSKMLVLAVHFGHLAKNIEKSSPLLDI